MHRGLILAVATISLAGCGKAMATAAPLESQNAAHCYSAFNLGNFFLAKDRRFAEPLAHGQARMQFERAHSRTAGRSDDDFLAEAAAVTRPHRQDPRPLLALIKPCELKQQNNPHFHEQY